MLSFKSGSVGVVMSCGFFWEIWVVNWVVDGVMFPLQCPAQFSVKVAMGIRVWCQNTLKHYSRQLFSFQDVNALIPPPQ